MERRSIEPVESWSRLDAVILSAIALCHRLFWLQWPALTPDSDEYSQLASWIVATGRFTRDGHTPTSYRPPLYPLFLALCSLVAPNRIEAILLIQAAFGTITVLLTYLIAARAFGRQSAVVAGLLLALAPTTARYS